MSTETVMSEADRPLIDKPALTLFISSLSPAGMHYVICAEHRGLLVAETTLAKALAAVPQALADLISVGGGFPEIAAMALPPPTA